MYTFPKKERLSSKKNIHPLFESGSTFFSHPFKIYYRFSDVEERKACAAVLFSVGKKQFKHAVDRNRIKRICKESYRLNKNLLTEKLKEESLQIDIAFVFVAKSIPDYHDLEFKMQKTINQLITIVQKQKNQE